MSAKSSLDLANFLAATDALMQANHAFFQKQEISPVGHSRQREAALSIGLSALARYLHVTLKAPLQIDSRGEFMLVVEQAGDGVATINQRNGSKVFGSAFAECLNPYAPRTGIFAGATMDADSAWCFMNHFNVEKMLLEVAERLKAEVLGAEVLGEGLQIVTVKGEIDQDEDGQERLTPPGSVGVLVERSMPGQWEVHFGDAAVHIGESELFNPTQYRLRSHFQADVQGLLEELGVLVAANPDVPGSWVWFSPSDVSQSAFEREMDAVDDAFAKALERSRIILSVPPEEWGLTPLDERMTLIRSAMCGEVSEAHHAQPRPS
jgi:hypothetical protein